jgi:thymidylate synthase
MIKGGRLSNENQLDDVLTSFLSRDGVRRSVLQVAVFNPRTDHVGSGPRGFPCLQHVSFAPLADGLSVNAFYASQYAIGRAYGNYLGICRLGRFVAHELGVGLARVTIFAGILQRDPNFAVQSLRALTTTIDEQLTENGT